MLYFLIDFFIFFDFVICFLLVFVMFSLFITMWMIRMGILRLVIMRFNSLSWINRISSQGWNCHWYYVLLRMSCIWCHTFWWLGMTCWRPRGPIKWWVIIWNSWCKHYLFWCSGTMIIWYYILVCFSCIFGFLFLIHGNISCFGVYFTWHSCFVLFLEYVYQNNKAMKI